MSHEAGKIIKSIEDKAKEEAEKKHKTLYHLLFNVIHPNILLNQQYL